MKKQTHPFDLEAAILFLQKKCENTSVSLGEIFAAFSGKGQSLTLVFLSLPFCQPLQIPGLSTPFGLAIAFIGLRMAFGRRMWLPKAIIEKKIAPNVLLKILTKTLWFIRKLKQWTHPRLTALTNNYVYHCANGLLIAVLGICLALPLPVPLSNLTAAWAIFFIGLGVLEGDGLFVLLGYFVSLIAFGLLISVAFSIRFIEHLLV